MDQNTDIVQMLELMTCPAFCVKNHIITTVSPDAQRMGITTGDNIADLLHTGKQEYPLFQEGCLHLNLLVAGSHYGASVTRMSDFDLFMLEQDADKLELQAMALAAQELRNPLSNIMAVTESISLQNAEGEAELTAQLNRGLYQLQRVICNMSDAYRYSQEDSAVPETRAINAFWEEFFTRNAALVSHTGIELHYTGLKEKVFGLIDAEKLERAAHNILANALKYTPKGGTIEARLTRRGAMLYLTIQDSGDGIPADLRGNVFHRYRRQPSIEDARHGIGLGMVLIRSVASMHGGTVLLEQTKEQGLRVTLSMAIRQRKDNFVYNNTMRIDYAGERDHALIELSETLPTAAYQNS